MSFLKDWLPPFSSANSVFNTVFATSTKSHILASIKSKVRSSQVSVQLFVVSPLGKEDYHIFISSLVHWGFLFVSFPNSPLFFSFLLCIREHILIPLA